MVTEKNERSTTPDPDRLAAARAALAAATEAATADAPAPAPGADGAEIERSSDRVLAKRGIGPAEDSSGPRTRRKSDGTSAEPSSPGVAEARQIALRQLAMGPRSRQQLTEKMAARNCEPQDIATVLDRMTDVGLVDDAAYAEMLVRTKREGSGLAATALRHELRKKGVAPDIAERAVSGEAPEDERSRAQQLVHARLGRMAGLDREVKMRRLAALLARKGYPSGIAISVVREAVDDLPEHRRD